AQPIDVGSFTYLPTDQPAMSNLSPDKDNQELAANRTARYAMFEKMRGRIIRHINFDNRDVFGAPVDMQQSMQSPWYGRIGNFIHYKTQAWVVNQKLLFTKGDIVDPYILRESERLLRASGLFVDARVIALPLADNNNEVDVQIVTQDRWSLVVPLSYKPETGTGFVGLKEENFLGLGHEMEARIDYDEDPAIGTGITFNHKAANLFGTYVNSGANYVSKENSKNIGVKLDRKFFSAATRWAGGVDLGWIDDEDRIFLGDSLRSRIPFRRQEQSVWVGRALGFKFGSLGLREKTRFVVAASFSRVNHSTRPHVTADSFQIYGNSNLVLAAAGLTYRDYYQDNYLNGFGATEDIPIGGFLKFIVGFEDREFNQRYYSGVEAAFAVQFSKRGYLGVDFAVGSFRKDKEWEQTIYRLAAQYHSPLFERSKWKFRFLAKNELILGLNRFEGEEIILNDDSGIRGFDKDLLRGTRRLVLNLDANIFSPYNVLGFVIGGNLFGDFGLIGEDQRGLRKSTVYQTYGVGLRIRNESLARSTIQVALIYSPNDPDHDKGSFGVLLSSNILFGFRDFSISRPDIITFDK
ncbi:MAG: hypothetical protein V3U73_03055, partial [bacterium]